MNYENLLNCAYENVCLKLEDDCNRFLIPKVKGHHLGSRTVVTNFLSLCSYLRRDPYHVMKFLAKELASLGEIKNDRLLFSRRLSSKEVNEKLEKYVCSFVLCPKCKKPDTEIVSENGRDFIRCLACGDKVVIHKI
jgi:translation initiation factor 2 subunit 2